MYAAKLTSIVDAILEEWYKVVGICDVNGNHDNGGVFTDTRVRNKVGSILGPNIARPNCQNVSLHGFMIEGSGNVEIE